jgi:short-subunit dehydrogenase
VRLSGATVLVTGASRGIGSLVATGAAARGARVVGVARPSPALEAVEGITPLPADLAEPAQRDGLVARAEELLGAPVDVLVNAAGVDGAGGFLDVGVEELRRLFEVNLLAQVELAHQALPGMVARRRGALVTVSSGFSTVLAPGIAAYAGSKAALSHWHALVAHELSGTGVTATLVEPGPVRTRMYDDLETTTLAGPALDRFRRLGLSRVVEPQELATAVLDGIESGAAPRARRMLPVVGMTWFPRAVARAVLTGVPRR